MKIFEEVVTVKLRGSFARPLHSSTRTSCTDMPAYLDEKHLSNDIRQYNEERVRCRWYRWIRDISGRMDWLEYVARQIFCEENLLGPREL